MRHMMCRSYALKVPSAYATRHTPHVLDHAKLLRHVAMLVDARRERQQIGRLLRSGAGQFGQVGGLTRRQHEFLAQRLAHGLALTLLETSLVQRGMSLEPGS